MAAEDYIDFMDDEGRDYIRRDEYVDILGEISLKHETSKAWLVTIDGEDVWVPKSRSDLETEADGEVRLGVEKWLADEKGLEYDDPF